MTIADQNLKFSVFYDADSSIDRIIVYPQHVEVEISYEEMKTKWTVVFHNHIALAQIGVWDETILDHKEILDSSSFITQAKSTIEANNRNLASPGMGTRIFDAEWFHYRIVLIDGSSLDVVASDVTVTTKGPANQAL